MHKPGVESCRDDIKVYLHAPCYMEGRLDMVVGYIQGRDGLVTLCPLPRLFENLLKFANPCDETNGCLVDVKRFVTELRHKSSNSKNSKKSKIKIKIEIKIKICLFP